MSVVVRAACPCGLTWTFGGKQRGQVPFLRSVAGRRAGMHSIRIRDRVTIRAEQGGQADILLADAPTKCTLPLTFGSDHECRRGADGTHDIARLQPA